MALDDYCLDYAASAAAAATTAASIDYFACCTPLRQTGAK